MLNSLTPDPAIAILEPTMKSATEKMIADLASLYGMAAKTAFGWAELRRQPTDNFVRGEKALSKEEAEAWLDKYTGGHHSTERLANQPGSPLHLIGLAFRNMQQSAEEWEAWGCRLLAAHDRLVA